jgi:hypothetical protein
MGGTVAGAGGTVAGTGGTVAGSAGCGFCPFVACAPPISLQVTAPADIVDLTGEVTNVTTGTKLGDLQCYPNGGVGACTWYCTFYQIAIGGGDYSIELTAPSYQTQTIEFSVPTPTNCGCCGCGCGGGYSGTVELVSNAAAPPECCAARDSDAMNCGTCGNACASGEVCNSGVCGPLCSGSGAGCSDGGQPCCSGLTCCAANASGQRQCLASCTI